MINLKKPSQKAMRPPKVKATTKVKTVRPITDPRPPKRPEKTRNKWLTKPNKTMTTKKTVFLLLRPGLLLQKKRQDRTNIFPSSFTINIIRKDIIQGNVLSQKTSCSLGDFYIVNY